MKYLRIPAFLATTSVLVLLSGCVVAPLETRPVAMYPGQPVYVQPVPLVVVPAPGYYYGYRGAYHGHPGHRHWR